MKTIYKAIVSRRTIRQFKQRPIAKAILTRLINAARLAPSAANLQPLEFIIVTNRDICARIFPHLRWANYIAPHGVPLADKRPVVYIAVLINKAKANIKYAAYDVGAAVENMILAAKEEGIGVCWMQAFNRDQIKAILGVAAGYALDSMLSLGYAAESPVAEKFKGSVKYWKDKKGRLHVPKRDMKQVLYKEII